MPVSLPADPPRCVVVVCDPFRRANARLVVAAGRAGGLGVLDLDGPGGPAAVASAVSTVTEQADRPWAVRLRAGAEVTVPSEAGTVILAAGAPVTAAAVTAAAIQASLTAAGGPGLAAERILGLPVGATVG